MIEQHTDIVNSDISDEQKIVQLYNICSHLYGVLDEVQESQKDLTFLQSVCRRQNKKGFYLKVDQSSDDYKATFWRGKGDGVETYSATSKDFVDAVEKAGIQENCQEVLSMIRAKYQENIIEQG